MQLDRFDGKKLVLSDEEWKKRLTAEQYQVLRKEATECAFANPFFDRKEQGVYFCAGCNLPLFASDQKFESETGWPSFWQPVYPENVEYRVDRSHDMVRIEVRWSRCGGHLGHAFPDGPPPTGVRYCMNSAALKFSPK